jgi:protein associated with RNAse G/E
LDQDEFDVHKIKFSYPEALINKIKEVETDIVAQYRKHEFKIYLNKKVFDNQEQELKSNVKNKYE